MEDAVSDEPGFTPPEPVPSMVPPTTAPHQQNPNSETSAPTRIRWWIPVVIVASVLLGLGLIGGGLAAVVSLISLSSSRTSQPLAEGDAGEPRAAEPLECPSACFDSSSIGDAVILETELNAVGLTQHDFPWGTYDPTSAGEMYRSAAASWRANDGSPDRCFFALGNSPAATVIDENEAAKNDEIQFTGEHADEDVRTTLDQSMRLFPRSADAMNYLTELHEQIGQCGLIEIGSPNERYSAEITPAPALSLPDSVAATGWVRTGDRGHRWRAYVVDLQRGNLVVRVRVLTDGAMTELDYRALVERYAEQLAALPANEGADPASVIGPPSSPYAVEPTVCIGSCIGSLTSNLSHPSKRDFDAVGLTVDQQDPAWPGSPFSARAVDLRNWDARDGSPAECFAVFSAFPVTGSGATDGSAVSNTLYFDGTHTNPALTLSFTQGTRLFPDSTSAVAYVEQENEEAKQCTEYTATVNGTAASTTVRPVAALPVPDNVAAIGWAEYSASGDRYVFDFQRGNLVVRSVIISQSVMSEAEAREFMASVATRVGAMRLDDM